MRNQPAVRAGGASEIRYIRRVNPDEAIHGTFFSK